MNPWADGGTHVSERSGSFEVKSNTCCFCLVGIICFDCALHTNCNAVNI